MWHCTQQRHKIYLTTAIRSVRISIVGEHSDVTLYFFIVAKQWDSWSQLLLTEDHQSFYTLLESLSWSALHWNWHSSPYLPIFANTHDSTIGWFIHCVLLFTTHVLPNHTFFSFPFDFHPPILPYFYIKAKLNCYITWHLTVNGAFFNKKVLAVLGHVRTCVMLRPAYY